MQLLRLRPNLLIPHPYQPLLPEFLEVAAPIEETVAALDLPEENISTLLCYLENSEEEEEGKQWVKLHNPVYSLCKIRDASLQIPPVALRVSTNLG